MDIDSLGEQTIKQLFDLGLVHSPADLYDLKKADLLRLEKVKDKSAENMLAGIEASKGTPFQSVLFAVGIRFVGKTVAEKLAYYFKSMDKLAAASVEELLKAPEVGLKKAGLQMESTEVEPQRISQKLEGKSFVISGTFENYERDQLKDVVLANGGRILSGVSAKLDYLLAGENMGPAKLEKAQKLGVTLITIADFEKMLTS
jgi:DNA ligase (NAD+)